jgi:hypothetical protein
MLFLQKTQTLKTGEGCVAMPSYYLKGAEAAENCLWKSRKFLYDGAAMGQFFGRCFFALGFVWS